MIFPLATLETGRKLVRVSFRKDFWNGYWGQGRHIRHYLNSASHVTIQGWKTFCASLIAGSRRAFLCVDCVGLCLFVTERVLTKTEWNARGVTVCFSKSLVTFVWSLFITTAGNFWRQIACPFEVKSGNALLLDQKKFLKSHYFASRGFIFAVRDVVRK